MEVKRLFILSLLAIFFHLPPVVWGQAHQEEIGTDTTKIKSVQQFFSKSELHGHVRNYFMATWNYQKLSDHYANALGAEIGLRTPSIHGFRMGISGLFTYNIFSSNLSEKDPIANKYPSTEVELFDVEDPENKANLDRLESAYLENTSGRLRAKIGRFGFTSPLINPQDTRMKPYTAQGAQLQVPIRKETLLTMAWLDHFSPRSVVEWQRAESTIGIVNPGMNIDGIPSAYHHYTETKGVAIAGLESGATGKVQGQVWNYWIENISNSSYGRLVVPAGKHLRLGLEGLYQFRVGNGGNSSLEKAYFPDQQAWLAGAMAGYSETDWQLTLSYLHTGKGGRFTFPREWGREQFFATLPRGRLEGTGKADLLVVKGRKRWAHNLSCELSIAKAWLPGPDDYAHSKYGGVSYWSSVLDLHYKPRYRPLQGLVFRLLYVAKVSPGVAAPISRMFYSTNYHQINFVTQVNF